MYPTYVTDSFGELSEFLLSQPNPDELDVRGCFSKEACSKVESVLLLAMQSLMEGAYFQEEEQRGVNPDSRWRVVSCMQKAIRFSDAGMARMCASVGYDMDSGHVLRRLGIIAAEDVAAGDLLAVVMVLAAMGSAKWRKANNERRVLIFLADMLASVHGDRNMTDLLNGADFDTTVSKAKLATMTSGELGFMAKDKSRPLVQRSVATWMMAGSNRYKGTNMPESNDRPATPLFRMMADEGVPRAFLYGAAKAASRLHSPLWLSFYLMNEQLLATEMVEVIVEADMPETPKVGKLLAAAYDMHTMEGKSAIRRLASDRAQIRAFRKYVPEWNRYVTAVCEAVFYVEGGALKTRVAYQGSEALRDESWRNIMTHNGLPPEVHGDFFAAIRDSLDQLHEIRADVLRTKLLKG